VVVGEEAAEWFEALAAYSPAAAFVRDGAGRYLWVNAAYAHLYGRAPEAVMGRTVEEVDPPGDAATARELDREVLASGRPVRHVIRFVHGDGVPGEAVGHRFALNGAGVVGGSGAVEGDGAAQGASRRVGGIYVDVTDHHRALEEMAAAGEELHALRERSGLAVVTLGLDGRVERVSAGAAELVGLRRVELEGGFAGDLLAEGSGSGGAGLPLGGWRELTVGRIARFSRVVVLRTAGGGGRAVRADLALVRRTGAPARVVAVLTPVGAEFGGLPRVSPVQLRVLVLLAEGEPNTAIAATLGLSRQALDYHLRRLRRLLDAPSRTGLVARAYCVGLLDATVWPPRACGAVRFG
jgi:PAS domain S-box-containing protein